MPCRRRVPGGLRPAGRLSRPRAAGERTRWRPGDGPGPTAVPRVVPLRSAAVPGTGLRAIGHRPVAGVSASRHCALLAEEAGAGAAGARASRAAEARHAMRAWHGLMPAREVGTSWRDR